MILNAYILKSRTLKIKFKDTTGSLSMHEVRLGNFGFKIYEESSIRTTETVQINKFGKLLIIKYQKS